MIDIRHYTETVQNPHGRFKTLVNIAFCKDRHGQFDFLSGSNAVIFKAERNGHKCAIKCYTKADGQRTERYRSVERYVKEVRNTAYLTAFEYRSDEAYVFDDEGYGCFYPVLVTEWVEGCSLDRWISRKCEAKERSALFGMACEFDRMGSWLLRQEWAHGDLKPENIIVTPRGELRLIDYDNVFVPELAGSASPELGTPEFQHPRRDKNHYDRHLDDYSIALISTALHTLAEFPEWYIRQKGYECLLFHPREALGGNSEYLNRIKEHWLSLGKTELYRLACALSAPEPEIRDLAAILKSVRQASEQRPAATGIITEDTLEVYRKDNLYGYRTPQGVPLTEAIYDDAAPFSDGLAAVRVGKKRFYIDTQGKKRIDASAYDQIEPFSEGLSTVRKGGKWGYIDTGGRLSIPFAFEQSLPFRENRAAVRSNGRWGFISPDGDFVIPPVFETAFGFREGAAVVRDGGLYGYIDPQGHWIHPPRYTFASGFREGTSIAEINGKTVRLRKKEDQIIETQSIQHP